jgi:hypothetical protein
MRETLLVPRGFHHVCDWCNKDLQTLDKRWCLKHDDCTMKPAGFLPLEGGFKVVRFGSVQLTDLGVLPGHLIDSICTACGELCEGVSRETYDENISMLTSWYSANNEDVWMLPTQVEGE